MQTIMCHFNFRSLIFRQIVTVKFPKTNVFEISCVPIILPKKDNVCPTVADQSLTNRYSKKRKIKLLQNYSSAHTKQSCTPTKIVQFERFTGLLSPVV